MSRSDAVRQEVKRLDGHRCAICGYDGRDEQFRPWVVPHHIEALGIGGSDERDVVENCVSLCSTVDGLGLPPNRRSFLGITGEGSCHQLIHDGHIVLANWDPETRTFDVLDMERHVIPRERLWCHRRRLAEELEPIEARIQGLHAIDGDVAADVWRLWKDDAYRALEPEAKSFAAYAASRGWDVRRAAEFARLFDKGREAGFAWATGTTAADFKRELKAAGIVAERTWQAFVFRDVATVERLETCGDMRRVRATDTELAEMTEPCVRANKMFRLGGT